MLNLFEAFLILDQDGNRIVSKTYGKNLPDDLNVLMHKNLPGPKFIAEKYIMISETVADVNFYALCLNTSNEILMELALSVFIEALAIILLDKNICKRNCFLEYDKVLELVDEMIGFDGVVLEFDSETLAARILTHRRTAKEETKGNVKLVAKSIWDNL
jgi:hypothetical protein